MAVKIRLTRLGDKKSPFYRVIVADSRSPRDGKFIDILETYNPLTNPAEIKIDNEKAKTWIKQKGGKINNNNKIKLQLVQQIL